jgi:uncharacterized protein YkwD
VSAESLVGSGQVGETGGVPAGHQNPADLLWNLNWLRNQAGLFGFEAYARLEQIAVDYCPDLARHFDESYDSSRGNWAEAMVHDAGDADLTARTLAAGYSGWTNELLAWTQERVDLSLVARGFWEAPTHAETLTNPDPTRAGVAICIGDAGYFYVVVIGGVAPPAVAEPEPPSRNPFTIP